MTPTSKSEIRPLPPAPSPVNDALSTPAAPSTTHDAYYRLIRGQIEHEDNLIAQRLSWFVAAQSFLFSAYAIVLNAPAQPATPEFGTQRQVMFRLIPLVAISSCVLIYVTILAGVLALQHLRELVRRYVPEHHLQAFPPVHGTAVTRATGLAAPLILPPVFVTAWLFLLTRGVG